MAALSLVFVATADSSSSTRKGYRITRIGPHLSSAESMAMQGRKILTGGLAFTEATTRNNPKQTGFALARYRPDGRLDRSFGHNGKVLTPFAKESGASAIAIDPAGGILAAGAVTPQRNGFPEPNLAIARFTAAGQVDSAFGTNGLTTTNFGGEDFGSELAVEGDGSILVAGTSFAGFRNTAFIAARYNPDGTLDSSFGTGGIVVSRPKPFCELYDLRLDANDSFKLAGSCTKDGAISPLHDRITVAGFTPDGHADMGFGHHGVEGRRFTPLTTGRPHAHPDDFVDDVSIQPHDRVVATGESSLYTRRRLIVKTRVDSFNADMSRVRQFGDHGTVTLPDRFGSSSAVTLGDGDLLLAGSTYIAHGRRSRFGMFRLHPSGAPDPRFGTNGWATTNIGGSNHGGEFGGNGQRIAALAFPTPGLVIAAGSGGRDPTSFAIARYHVSSGELDHTFGRR